MKNFITLLSIFGLALFSMSLSVSAQESPAESKSQSAEALQPDSANDRQESDAAKSQPQDDQEPDEKESDDKKSDDKPTEGQKSDDKDSEDQQSDDKPSEDKPSEDKQSEDKQSDDKQSDDKQSDDKQSDDDRSSGTSGLTRALGLNPWSRDSERVNSYSKKSDDFVGVFQSVVASADASTLEVMSGKRQIALGTVIDSNGLVLTKASELRGQIGCKLLDGTIAEATVVGIDPETDLALLKVDAENLNVIQWSQDPTPVTGQWLATPKGEKDTPTIGVVSVNARAIPPSRPFIGITMENVPQSGGVRITTVVPRSPADSADIWVNDVITKIDDDTVTDITVLRDILKNYEIDDRITLGVTRGKKKLNIKLTLAERDKISPENLRSNQQNSMGSILSRRRKDFPSSFQHDSMLSSKTCGGPIVDLSGKVVGINIARAGRVSSLALTAATVLPVIARLKSGNLAPEVVNKSKIESIDAELKEIDAKLGKLPDSKIDLERKYNVEKARLEELEKSMEDLKERMKVIDEKATEYKSELDSVKRELRNIERVRQRLEADRKQLATGSR